MAHEHPRRPRIGDEELEAIVKGACLGAKALGHRQPTREAIRDRWNLGGRCDLRRIGHALRRLRDRGEIPRLGAGKIGLRAATPEEVEAELARLDAIRRARPDPAPPEKPPVDWGEVVRQHLERERRIFAHRGAVACT